MPSGYSDDAVPHPAHPETVRTGYDLWVLTHPDLRRMARVRVVLDLLYEELALLKPVIEGTNL